MYGYNTAFVGSRGHNPMASRHSTGLSLDEAKSWLEEESFGVKRKYLAIGAVVLGVGYYGYTQGWFR